MMALVSGDHEPERAHADRLAARRPAAPPRIGVERAQQRERRGPRGAQLPDEIGQRAAIELGDGDVGVLVESGQRRRVAARDAQRPVGHDALDVGEMADDFLDAPFAAAIAVHRVRLGEAAQQRGRVLDLCRAHDHRIELRDAIHVADVVRRNLVGLGPSNRPRVHGDLPSSSVSAIAFTVLPSRVRIRR